MLRLILSVVAGLFVGVILVAVLEAAGHAVFPPPAGVDLTDPQALDSVMSKLPREALAAVLAAWFLGVLGGATTANLANRRQGLAGWIVSAVIFAFAAWTMAAIPHPLWFVIAAVVLMLTAAIAADRAFGRPRG
jgi:hypothetical protein